MSRAWLTVGSILAALGVALGAFGAHGLKTRVSPDDLAIWETASRYHLIHAVGLIAVAWATERWPGGWTQASGWLLAVGVVVFSGSLYALVLTGQRWLGAVTPLGGLCFIAGWIALAVSAWRR